MPDDAVMQGFWLVLTGSLGLCLGSFATALSYRLPRGISMIKKARSSCPSCGHVLGAPDLVPVFSWLFLRGKCRHCKAPIGLRYVIIECAVVVLCYAFLWRFGAQASVFAFFALAPIVVSIVDIDIHYKIIPDALNLVIALLAAVGVALAACGAASPYDAVVNMGAAAIIGMAAYGAGAWLLRFGAARVLKREPMGLGDVKFFAAAGAWLGSDAQTAAWFMCAAGALGVVFALFWQKTAKEKEFPFGPALLAAFVLMLFLQGAVFAAV